MQALVAFRGNRYSVPPGQLVHVRHQLAALTLDIATSRGVRAAHHLRAPTVPPRWSGSTSTSQR